MLTFPVYLLLAFGPLSLAFPQEVVHDAAPLIEEEKRPYSFAWSASRHFNGLPDREHQEERGADGITRGVFRYVDPRFRIQEISYVADESGFHVDPSNLPQDTNAVKTAKEAHLKKFEEIRMEHARLAALLEERARESVAS